VSTSRFDLNLGDLDEVRRRVVDPVLSAMLRPGELVSADLVVDDDWPGLDDEHWAFHRWPNNPHAPPPGTEPRSLYLVIHAIGDEQHTAQLGSIAFYLDDARDIADSLESSLSDWICETRFGWADARGTDGLELPGPRLDEQGRPTVEVWASEGGSPLTVDRVPTDPGDLGLSDALATELREWQAIYAAAAEESEAEDQRRYADQMGEQQPFGVTVTYVDDATAAQQAAAAAQAREQEHLGSWQQLVARLEPMRDALLERLRNELGEAFYVPNPTRVP
jgi:hypothetical protein